MIAIPKPVVSGFTVFWAIFALKQENCLIYLVDKSGNYFGGRYKIRIPPPQVAKVHEVDTILQKWAMQQQFTGKMEALTRRQAPPKGRSLFFKFNVSLPEWKPQA